MGEAEPSFGGISPLLWGIALLFTGSQRENGCINGAGSGDLHEQSLGPRPGHLVPGLTLAGWPFVFLGYQLGAETGFQRLEKWPDLCGGSVADPHWGTASHRLAEFRDSTSSTYSSGQFLRGRPQSLCDQTVVF